MDLTNTYEKAISESIRNRYELRETRKAASVIEVTNPLAFGQVIDILSSFQLYRDDIIVPGGQESKVAKRLNEAFRTLGWREGKIDMTVALRLRLMPYRKAGERKPLVEETEVLSQGYKVDNVRGRLVCDIEWHAKDGNLDRDVAAYRALYDSGLIDGAIIITRSFESIRDLSTHLGRPGGFNTTTTTTLEKLEPRLGRGDGGGCPILAVAITDRCYAP
ncbi:MAG: BglII/BstYI family type II restriction endonuclease [Actinomycetota bacterium]